MKKSLEFSAGETKELKKFLAAVRLFKDLHKGFPVSHIEGLLAVALNPGQGSGDYATWMDEDKASTSRILGTIGERPRRTDKCHNLIEQYDDPVDSRKTQYYLTPAGHTFLKKLLEARSV